MSQLEISTVVKQKKQKKESYGKKYIHNRLLLGICKKKR